MICPNCGKEIREGVLFCNQCGTPVHTVNMELNSEKALVNDEQLSYSNKSKTAAVVLAVMALVFSLVPRLAMHATAGSILVFAIVPGVAMLIFCCLLNKSNPVYIRKTKWRTLL